MLARRVKHDFRAAAIDGMKVVPARHPHAGQRCKVVNLFDVVERFAHPFLVEDRSFDILRYPAGELGWALVENPDPTTLGEEGSHQVLPDKAAAARNERLRHGVRPASARRSAG